MTIYLQTLSDVVDLLRTKDARENGIEERAFHRNGILSLDAVAFDLRARGYEIEVFEAKQEKRIRLVAGPREGVRRRQKQQLAFPGTSPKDRPRGPYGPEP